MKKFLLLLIVASISISGYAQIQVRPLDLPQVFSPDAAELGKYGKIPVNYFNGLPNITIPLTEFRAKNYTLPVYLSYHASGNRPENHPGWVGQGWTLHAGGCINRIIRGRKDEVLNEDISVEEYLGERLNVTREIGYLHNVDRFQSINWDDSTSNEVSRYKRELIDSNQNDDEEYAYDYEPDEFQINIEDISASFYFVGGGKVKIVSKSDADFTVTYTMNDFYDIWAGGHRLDYRYAQGSKILAYTTFHEFIVTKKDGTRYHFGGDEDAIEYSMNAEFLAGDYPQYNMRATANTWMLTKIERPDGEEIVFNYKRDGVPIVEVVSESWETVAWDYNPSGVTRGGGDGIGFHFLLPSYLESISCKYGTDHLFFKASKSTQKKYKYSDTVFKRHVSGSNYMRLDSLKARDYYPQLTRIETTRGTVVLDYTSDPDTRLKLESVRIEAGQNDPIRYELTYNTTPLPEYNSRKTDPWGYYNTTISYKTAPGKTLYERRNIVNPRLLQAEMLTEIKYPTGGKTCFEYEPHDYSKVATQFPFGIESKSGRVGGLRIKKMTDYPTEGKPEERIFTYSNPDGQSSGILSGKPEFYIQPTEHSMFGGTPEENGGGSDSSNESLFDKIESFLGDILAKIEDLVFLANDSFVYIAFSEHALNQLSDTDGNHVTYSKVTETIPGSGKTEYWYSNHDTNEMVCLDKRPTKIYNNFDDQILHNPFTSLSLSRGLLLRKCSSDKNGIVVQTEDNTYAQDLNDHIFSLFQYVVFCNCNICRRSLNRIYTYYPALTRKVVKTYPDEGSYPSEETTEYSYNSHRQLTKIVRRNSSSSEEIRMTYSGDMPDNKSPYGDMKAAGIFDRPVQKTVLRGIPIVSSSLTTYRKINTQSGDQFVPDKYYESRLSSPIPAHLNTWTTYSGELTADLQTFFGAPRITFDSYDAYGNILSATDEGGRCSRYCWDNKGLNPEASFSGMLNSARTVQVETTISERVNFRNKRVREYTYEFDADYAGEFSFVLLWRDGEDYSIRGYMDGKSVFLHRQEVIPGGEDTPRRAPRINPDTEILPILLPTTELYNGTVTAGHHVFKVIRVIESQSGSLGGNTSSFLDGIGTITYPIYRTEQHSDNQGTWYYSFEANGNQEGGFNSDKAWHGSKKFTQTIPSDVPYTIDWMEQGSNGKWAYKSSAFTGTKTLGSSTKTIDNVRIYPSAATATNWTWTSAGELRSVTDGSGMTTSYEYDGMGRLATVLDIDENKIASYEYHYTLPSATTPDSYVKTLQYTDASGSLATETINYHDGLGRPWQTISEKAGKTNAGTATRNLCVRTDYDASGRPYRTWLPFRTTGIAPQTAAQPSESIYSDNEPFSYVEYDGSPLDRPRAEYGPGKKWHTNGKAVRYGYYTNGFTQLMNVNSYRIGTARDTTVTVNRNGMYPYTTLSVKSVKDEDGLTLLTFTDMYGRTVLERRHPISGEDVDTYYLYDDMGRLAAVLPPALSKMSSISSTDLDKYAYLYTYDANGNCTAKKLPGCGWTRYIYDKGNRPVFSQDAENRRMGRWMFSFSDIHGRSCVSGYCEGDMATLKQAVSASNVVATRQGTAGGPYMGYSVSGLSLTNPVVLSVSYYDDYDFITSQVPSGKRSLMTYSAEYGLTKWNYVHGLATGGAERILGEGVTNDFRWNACYYDKKGNMIQARTTRKDGGVDVATTEATFTGKPKRAHISHNYGQSGELNEYYEYTYDSWERPLTVKHRMGESADPTVLSDIKYDGIGRVISDDRNGIPSMKTSFSYNVRSWTKSITGPGLSEAMSYEEGGQWGGNISGINWSAGTGSKAFQDTYGYDGLSRLSNSTRYMTSEPSHKYINEYTYDGHSNIVQSLYKEQNTGSLSSTLKVFNHNGNRLVSGSITTGTNSQQVAYAYDRNGRMTLSEDQGLTEIRYNSVGYPSYIKIAGNGHVDNTYTSGGTKLESRRTDANGEVTAMAYEGNEVFENGQRRMLLFDGGYVDFSGNEPRYCWYTKDHLGSVRAVADAEGNVFSKYAYGPYGEDFAVENLAETTLGELGPITYDGVIPDLDHISVYPGEMSQYSGISGSINGNGGSGSPTVTYSANASSNWQPYKFSGKESLTRVGLDLYDFGARMYSPSNMRWMTMDPLAEKYYHVSPYVYCEGNPANLIDPDGLEGIVVSGQPGDHNNREHFLVNGLNRAQQLVKQYRSEKTGESVTWFIYTSDTSGGYDKKTLDKYVKQAEKSGIQVKVVDDADSIVDYVNKKDGGESRSNDLVSEFVYVGHATPGDLDIGFIDHSPLHMLFNETLDVSKFKPSAFSEDSNANLVGGCRTAVGSLFERSVASQMARKVGGKVKASSVRVNYSGGVMSDKQLVGNKKENIVVFDGKKKK